MSETDTVDSDTVDTETVHPPPDVDEEEEGEEDAVLVTVSIQVHGRRWSSDAMFSEMPDDATLADELVNVLTAVSVMRGSGLWFEVSRRLRPGG